MMLQGERIALRTITKDDIDTVFELTRQYPDMDDLFPMSLLSELIVRKHFEPGESPESAGENPGRCLLITDKTGTIIGSIAYFKGPRYVAGLELAYHIFRPVNRGKGYMGEALRLLAAYQKKKK
ncbi:MAG: GNAT family N-acetyltransferase, partial [bacterium]|nr:GNAT family N-acetyltransferase [bacterium]